MEGGGRVAKYSEFVVALEFDLDFVNSGKLEMVLEQINNVIKIFVKSA